MAKKPVGRKVIGTYSFKPRGARALALQPGPQTIAWDEIRPRPDLDTRSLDPRHILSLARSIAAVGLIQPIAIDTRGKLIAGGHRLAVWALLDVDDAEARRTAFLKGLSGYTPTAEHDPANPSEPEAMATEIGTLDVSGWKDAHPKSLVPVLVFDEDEAKKKNNALLREVAENEKRRGYTAADVKALAVRLERAGFEDIKGRPAEEQQSVRVELGRILGRSSRQIRRYLNDPEAAKPKVGHHVRLVGRLKRLVKAIALARKGCIAEGDARHVVQAAEKLSEAIATYVEEQV